MIEDILSVKLDHQSERSNRCASAVGIAAAIVTRAAVAVRLCRTWDGDLKFLFLLIQIQRVLLGRVCAHTQRREADHLGICVVAGTVGAVELDGDGHVDVRVCASLVVFVEERRKIQGVGEFDRQHRFLRVDEDFSAMGGPSVQQIV